VLNAVFAPDGTRVATASADGRANLWDLKNPRSDTAEYLHGDDVFSVAFSSDGKRLLTASRDKTAKIWRGADSEPDLVLSHGPVGVRAAAFAPGDASVVTGAEDGMVRLWRIRASELVEYMAKASTACLTPAERVRFIGETQKTARPAYEACEAAHGRTAPRHP